MKASARPAADALESPPLRNRRLELHRLRALILVDVVAWMEKPLSLPYGNSNKLWVDICSVWWYPHNGCVKWASRLYKPLAVAMQETLHLRFAEESRSIRGRIRRLPRFSEAQS